MKTIDQMLIAVMKTPEVDKTRYAEYTIMYAGTTKIIQAGLLDPTKHFTMPKFGCMVDIKIRKEGYVPAKLTDLDVSNKDGSKFQINIPLVLRADLPF